MLVGLVGALLAAVSYGAASVLQALGARRVGASGELRLLARVLAQRVFLLGIALDVLGFLLSLTALRTVPLFVVEPVVAANLVVTAVLAPHFLGITLTAREWAAVVLTCLGLAALGAVGHTAGTTRGGTGLHVLLLVCAVLLAGPALLAGRLGPARAAAGLGAVAGIAFAVLAVAVRVLPSLRPADLVTDTATYAAIVSGLLGFGCYTVALQRGRVTTATAAMVTGETVLPAVLGIVLLGDRTRPGLGWLAVVGFLLAVAGAVALARFAEPDPPAPSSDFAVDQRP